MAPRNPRILIKEVAIFQPHSSPTVPPTASPPSRRSVSDNTQFNRRISTSTTIFNSPTLSPSGTNVNYKKSTARRISDFLLPSHSAIPTSTSTSTTSNLGLGENGKEMKAPNLGSKNDLWLIILSDVVIRCRRIGVTDIPSGFIRGGSNNSKKDKKDNNNNNNNNSRIAKIGKVRNLCEFIFLFSYFLSLGYWKRY